ncbi:MAG: hypothetical protein ACRDJN_22980 [Chloroflexota bacterium]
MDATAQGEALLARYAAIRRLTAALRDAAEQDRTPDLERLAAERAAELEGAQQALAALGSDAGRLAPALRERALAELQEIERQDDALRALLAARAQEVPARLAEVRLARSKLAGRGRAAPRPPSLLDKRT